MKGDFSRISYDRTKHYSRVLKQQGRVDLDADHNDGAEIHHHLDRVTRRDVIGHAGVPTKNGAFALEPTPDHQDLFISKGRFYLDGLVLEVDATSLPAKAVTGDPFSVTVDDWAVDGQEFRKDQYVLLEATGQPAARLKVTNIDATTRKLTLGANVSAYTSAAGGARLQRLPTLRTQPDAPESKSDLTPGVPLLLYVEAFERHVTELEDPTLREIALGGVDTTTRVKTVWRLLRHDAPSVDDCASPVPGWPPKPGNGRLSTSAVGTPQSDDPCVLPPQGGYRGLENRLYRVEIHTAADPSKSKLATYKWSRDNGAVAFAIEGFVKPDPPAVPAPPITTIKLTMMGRDRTLTLREGDWVEVTDDEDDLKGASGILAQVEDVDLAERTVRLAGIDLTAYDTRKRRPKLRRWDMTGATVKADGIPIDFSEDTLEDGVQIKISGDDLRPGDWWSFAARVATADVERLYGRAPFNEHRKHARIALLTWEMDPTTGTKTPKLQDCRKPFDPLTEPCGCCCDVTVGDGVESFGDFTDLQKALNSIDHKGRVCILKGTHKVKETVTTTKGPLHIRACGSNARILGPAGEPTLVVKGAGRVTLENLFITATSPTALVSAQNAKAVKLVRCTITNGSDAQSPGPAIGVSTGNDIAVEECTLLGAPSISLDGRGARILRNRMKGGIVLLDKCDDVRIEDNDVAGGLGDGITLGGTKASSKKPDVLGRVVIARNRIRDMERNGIASRDPLDAEDRVPFLHDLVLVENEIIGCLVKPPAPTGAFAQASGGVVLRNLLRAAIHGNRVLHNGDAQARAVGILAQGAGVVLTDNVVDANGGQAEPDAGTQYSVSFEGTDAPREQSGNTRTVNGVRFEVFDHSGQPEEMTYVKNEGNMQGLHAGNRMNIVLPQPTSGLSAKIGTWGNPVTLVATSSTGAKEEKSTTQSQVAEEIKFNLGSITRIEVFSPSSETLLGRLDTGAVPPQPLQGGIFAFAIDAVPVADKKGATDKPVEEKKPAMKLMWPAAQDFTIHDNVVTAPRGPALVVVSRGPVSVQDNALRTDAVAVQGEPMLDVAACVVVYASGNVLYRQEDFNIPGAKFAAADKPNYAALFNAPDDRRALVSGNQALLRQNEGKDALPLGAFITEDDLVLESNQFRADLGEKRLTWSVLAVAKTLQVRGNRFYETPDRADLSLRARGMAGYVMLNVAMHCISATSPLKATDNIVQLDQDERCDKVLQKYQ